MIFLFGKPYNLRPLILGIHQGTAKKKLHSGILQLKLFNLFQAFSSWGRGGGVAPYFFLVLCLRATLHYQNAWKRLETIS